MLLNLYIHVKAYRGDQKSCATSETYEIKHAGFDFSEQFLATWEFDSIKVNWILRKGCGSIGCKAAKKL